MSPRVHARRCRRTGSANAVVSGARICRHVSELLVALECSKKELVSNVMEKYVLRIAALQFYLQHSSKLKRAKIFHAKRFLKRFIATLRKVGKTALRKICLGLD